MLDNSIVAHHLRRASKLHHLLPRTHGNIYGTDSDRSLNPAHGGADGAAGSDRAVGSASIGNRVCTATLAYTKVIGASK